MTFNKKVKDIFWITCYASTLYELGDYYVGDMFNEVLILKYTEMKPSQSSTKSLKRVDINLYEGVGKIYDISKDNLPTLLFDCGIYILCREDATLPEGIESGSFVKIRFYLEFDEGNSDNVRINGESMFKVIPEISPEWRIKDILVLVKDKKYFKDQPVAYESNSGDIYKSIRQTHAYDDCGGRAKYVFVCEML
ncbi:hypothetical protein [Candidatus Magnetominusculus xianensis]|uniref:Uncharacterized protein n=1 Tax=Candidatus Magnetominusculus xianensis TaxID=1748249 RepID=A0ABR5SIE5_9BACT|nr:hypothetical protein [Candidatus Magnetominusculus xianensis]KWT88351.1 hypothetical protein ASN18_1273 [Candidatus Magnetominusculus xianensis]MBF0405444.1 hypothetical protein [Nitrospirota bacterium]